MTSLMERIVKQSNSEHASVLDKAEHLNSDNMIPTSLPILNAALSGSLHGGFYPGITMVAGESRTFKTTLSLLAAKAFLDAKPEGVIMFYDCEFGARNQMLQNVGIDTGRVAHIPFTNLEELRNDMVQQLEKLKIEDDVFILVDSIGNTASKKEVDDALSGNSAEDMSRAKKLKSFFRIITPSLTLKKIPLWGVNHVYQEMGMFPKTHMSGGQGPMLSSDTVLFVTKAQMKEGTEKVGNNFNVKVEKSRFVKEGSKLPISVSFDKGIIPWSGLFELAAEAGYIQMPSKGWYTVEGREGKIRKADMQNIEFWLPLLKDPEFDKYVKDKLVLSDLSLPDEDMDSSVSAFEKSEFVEVNEEMVEDVD